MSPKGQRAEPAEAKPPADPPRIAPPAQLTLSHHVDEKPNQIYFQVVDRQSGQVICQVPPAEVLALEGRIAQMLDAEEKAAKR